LVMNFPHISGIIERKLSPFELSFLCSQPCYHNLFDLLALTVLVIGWLHQYHSES
jgi:hypothetical protein